ncbi:MAG: prepilin-type N-terminal cleavage/methylation domain-containing protein [[Clostridium] aminophilum]|uniref:type IV pilin protein n=1 Tax=[Clostridium] aminophilum TaxID=1526 RepID=UPI0026F36F17|nr:prepilin-type N-terminal cleavage/methylation domain-containing protein [[Clostridium] aminophilum]MDD6195715.1 prepilin-type N-terminal cleavage/methylation domain-containing protein [[Clostridium] aminophilum]
MIEIIAEPIRRTRSLSESTVSAMKGFITNRSKAPAGEEEEMIMLKIMRERKGFTLAELLIVVAIIGVLVAIAIPIFTAQLEKSRDAVSAANARAAYAEAAVAKLNQETVGRAEYNEPAKTVTVNDVVVKGENDNGAFYGSGKSIELPFTIDDDDAKKLDKAPAGGKVDITFTWSDTDVCTATVSES